MKVARTSSYSQISAVLFSFLFIHGSWWIVSGLQVSGLVASGETRTDHLFPSHNRIRKLLDNKLQGKVDQENKYRYLNNDELLRFLGGFSRRCKNISHLYSIGDSVDGFPLMVLEITDSPKVEEAEPAFKFVGNIHGDEPLGRQMLVFLADWLCENYQKDADATFIVDNVHLHLLMSLNPDGFKNRERNNAHQVDLNRDFPDQFHGHNNEEQLRQSETKAIMKWSRKEAFVASVSLHEGAVVANYPWDGTWNRRSEYSGCPDDATFRVLAETYSSKHPLMWNSTEFPHGITNGAAWYTVYGSMQDWNYIHTGCLELTVEINTQKWPPEGELEYHWEMNRPAMLSLVKKATTMGIRGNVTSGSTGNPLGAKIRIDGIDVDIIVKKKLGNFHRPLVPGTYNVTAMRSGFEPEVTTVTVEEGIVTVVNFVLYPSPPPPPALLNGTNITTEDANLTAINAGHVFMFGKAGYMQDWVQRNIWRQDYSFQHTFAPEYEIFSAIFGLGVIGLAVYFIAYRRTRFRVSQAIRSLRDMEQGGQE